MAAIYETATGFGVDWRDEYGRRRRKIIGSQAAAQAVALRIEHEVGLAQEANRKARKQSPAISVTEATNAYINFHASAATTRKQLMLHAKTTAKHIGTMNAADVTPQIIDHLITERRKALAPTTLAGEIYWLKRLFGWMCSQWMIASDPTAGLKAPHAEAHAATTITYEEEAALILHATPRTRLKILLALDAGLRHGETLALRANHANLEQRMLTVWASKTRTWRQVPLTARLTWHLKQRIREDTNPDAPIINVGGRAVKNRNTLHPLRRAAGVYFRFHDLRHTFASRINAVAGPEAARVLLGHAPTTNTQRYIHPSEEELRAAVNRMEAANPNAASHREEPQPEKEHEETMPGKRYTLRIKGAQYGHINLNRVRPCTDQTGVNAGNILVERENDSTHYTVALKDLEEIHQPSTLPKGDTNR